MELTATEVSKDSQVKEIQSEFGGILNQAIQVSKEISNEGTYQKAADFLLKIKQRLKFWTEYNKPVKQALDKAKREVLDRERQIAEPMERAEREYLKPAMIRYQQAQDVIRREAEAKAQAELQKRLEDERLAQAAQLEETGNKQAAEQVINTPVVAPPVVLPSVEKTRGIGVSKAWKFSISNVDIVPRKYLIVDEKALGQVVRALKDKAIIPGVKVWSEDTIRAGGRT